MRIAFIFFAAIAFASAVVCIASGFLMMIFAVMENGEY